jgi:hypothetical protein
VTWDLGLVSAPVLSDLMGMTYGNNWSFDSEFIFDSVPSEMQRT